MGIRRIEGIALLLVIACLAGCAGAPTNGEPSPEAEAGSPPVASAPPGPGATPAEPDPEDTKASQRLIYCEGALSNMHSAKLRQKQDEVESIRRVLVTEAKKNWPLMVQDLRFRSPRYRQTMAAALGFAQTPDVLPALYEALEDEYHMVVKNALYGLSELALGGVKGDPGPVVAYLDHPQAGIRANAALVLQRILDENSPETHILDLVRALGDENPKVRVHAVGALTAMRRLEAVPHLVRALADPIELVRIRAALGLGLLRSRAAVPRLLDALSDPEEKREVRKASGAALRYILDLPESRVPQDFLDPTAWRKLAREAGVEGV